MVTRNKSMSKTKFTSNSKSNSKSNSNSNGSTLMTSSVFYTIMILIAFIGIFYMMMLSFATSNLGMFAAAMIFGTMLIVSIQFGKEIVLNSNEPIGLSSTFFFVGFVLWYTIGSLSKTYSLFSLFALPEQSLMSTLAGSIPSNWQLILSGFMAPIVEELFWFVVLGYLLLGILQSLSSTIPILGNKLIQILILIGFGSYTFAAFHTSQALISFFIIAFIFRSIMIVLEFGDNLFNILPFTNVTLALLMGFHAGNNFSSLTPSFLGGISLLMQNPVGIGIVLTFGVLFVVSVRYILGVGKRR